MNDFLNNLFQELGEYISNTRGSISTFEFWLYPIITILFIWALTIIFTKILYQNKKVYTYKKTYYIYHSWIISSLIAATILISVIIILHLDYFYSNHDVDLRLSHLISLLFAFISAIIAFSSLRKYYRHYNLKEIVNLPLTSLDERNNALRAKKSYSRIKFWLFAPALGFVFLLMLLKNQGNVYSIVFDNSRSVSPEQLENPKKALIQTINKMGNKNYFFLTTLQNMAELPYERIIATTLEEADDLNALTAPNLDRFSCLAFLNDLKNDEENIQGTALTEAIWQNYLFVNNAVANNDIKKKDIKRLIIITDCDEDIMSTQPRDIFSTGFNNIFPIEKVKIVDVSAELNIDKKFYDSMVNQLGVLIEPGFDYYDCVSSLQLAMPPNNLILIVWLLIIYLVSAIVIMLIKPAKLR